MKTLILTLVIVSQLLSAPAFNIFRTFTNADGSSFKARAQGNQNLNWIETEDKEILKYNTQSKNFEYAIIQNNLLLPSGRMYSVDNIQKAPSLNANNLEVKDVYELWKLKSEAYYRKIHN